ncbi:MAG: hypothetical protein GWN99_19085 [Gemmatimonadetes bacterium]|uniref:Glycosyltransferase RgtA/B/C/D-like domain-containing protein n=1 Tax=Candidatus Kutchimonas denitrificans TaxID=3056748 RepID=A0AAE5CAW6_9BACT|nr:hypothetical protein [Gemmatimonadota bacterium]NIR73770.1 hypothetical protein [Candidatus Kutchimonas denitrificans]NIS03134.1 hypothetical protein [Gemmatimonadota bacterium]NIT69035.1 hypothetical protein [Gemmatimonadota bacterium]NIU54126.1 hypothetical protein [Gemmatimonadota bacterium]
MRRLVDKTRLHRLAMAALVGAVVASVGVWAQNDALVGVNYDDAVYAWLARSLADGEGYRLSYLPEPLPGIKYPPVYPTSLAAFWTISSDREAAFDRMKWVNGIYIGLAAGLFAFLLAELGILTAPVAAVVALLGFVSGSMMLVTSGLLSEPLYLVLLWGTLLAADGTTERSGIWRFVGVGVLAAAVALTRMVGLAAVIAVCVGIAWRRDRRRALIVAVAAGLTLLPWIIYTLVAADQVPAVLVPRYGSYLQRYLSGVGSSPGAALDIAFTNIGAMLQTLGAKLTPWLGAAGQGAAGVLLLVFAILGARRVARLAPATAIYPWLYLAVMATWTFPPFRFLFILIPLLLALALVGVLRLADGLQEALDQGGPDAATRRGGWARLAVIGVVVILGIDLGYREVGSVARRVWDGAELEKSAVAAELVAWVEDNVRPEAVVAFEFDPLLALYSGRRTAPNNYEPLHPWYQSREPGVDELASLLVDLGVDYVAVRRDVAVAAAPIDALMGRHPGWLGIVHVTPRGVVVLRVTEEAGPAVADLTAPRNGTDREEQR